MLSVIRGNGEQRSASMTEALPMSPNTVPSDSVPASCSIQAANGASPSFMTQAKRAPPGKRKSAVTPASATPAEDERPSKRSATPEPCAPSLQTPDTPVCNFQAELRAAETQPDDEDAESLSLQRGTAVPQFELQQHQPEDEAAAAHHAGRGLGMIGAMLSPLLNVFSSQRGHGHAAQHLPASDHQDRDSQDAVPGPKSDDQRNHASTSDAHNHHHQNAAAERPSTSASEPAGCSSDQQHHQPHQCSLDRVPPGQAHHPPPPEVPEAAESDLEDEDEEEFVTFDPLVFIKTLPPLEACAPPFRPAILPRKTRLCKQKTLVLDLDETLVHSSLETVPHGCDFSFAVHFNNQEHQIHVRKRPHLQHFMERVAQLFEIVVFTASQRVYAEKLLNIIDPTRTLIKHRIYRESCVVVDGNYLKDLTVLGRDLRTTLIVDNSPQAFGFQVDNGVPIESWYEDDGDEELLKLLPFLESLVDVDDVRPHIARKFRLREMVERVAL